MPNLRRRYRWKKGANLILAALICALATCHAWCGDRVADRRHSNSLRVTVAWDNVPLGGVVRRLRESQLAQIVVDRRIDPTQEVAFRANQVMPDALVQKLAGSLGVEAVPLVAGYYFVPPSRGDAFQQLLESQRKLVRAEPQQVVRRLLKRRSLAWKRLQTPREILVAHLASASFRVANPEEIPHDLWDAGALPPIPVSDAISLILFGFDLTFTLEGNEVRIIRLPAGEPPGS